MLHYFGYFAAIFIGLSLGIMGGGGSILTVPVLVYLMGVSPVLSTAYSLFIVGSTSLVGTAGYFRKGLVALPTAQTADDYEALLPWSISMPAD